MEKKPPLLGTTNCWCCGTDTEPAPTWSENDWLCSECLEEHAAANQLQEAVLV